MKNSWWKNILIVLTITVLIIGGTSWYIYAHRGQIAEKIVDYTVQKITGADDKIQDSWVASLMDSGSKNIKTALIDAMLKDNGKENGKNNKRRPGLATMAEMFANGTAGDDSLDLNQMTKAIVSSLGGQIVDKNAVAGHDINVRDEDGRTLLMKVCRVDVSADVVDLLLQYGAQVDVTDADGRTALMYAAAYNQSPEVIKVLLRHGAKAKHIDNKGHTASDYAKSDDVKALLP